MLFIELKTLWQRLCVTDVSKWIASGIWLNLIVRVVLFNPFPHTAFLQQTTCKANDILFPNAICHMSHVTLKLNAFPHIDYF